MGSAAGVAVPRLRAGDIAGGSRDLRDAAEQRPVARPRRTATAGTRDPPATQVDRGFATWRAQTLRFEDELRAPEQVGLPEREPPERTEVSRLERLIKNHSAARLDERWVRDEYAQSVRELVERKRKRREDVIRLESDTESDDEEPMAELDLLETIKRSLQHHNGARVNGRDSKRSASSNRKRLTRSELAAMTKDELYARAQELDIPGRSAMKKDELVRELVRLRSDS